MIGTEQRLWKVMDKAVEDSRGAWGQLTRIETTTVDGVADVEYVSCPWHGWIELKTVNKPHRGHPFALHAPYTLMQCAWLLGHHNPEKYLRSWLLIGVIGVRTWGSYVLIPAPCTTYLLSNRKRPSHEWLLQRPGVRQEKSIGAILSHIQALI